MSYEVDYIPWLERQKERLTFKYNKMKAERDTLIDDIAVLRANISRLERENERLFYSLHEMTEHDKGMCELAYKLRAENKILRLQADKYTTLTNHIRLKAENNPGVSRYIDLVNYIDRLERD